MENNDDKLKFMIILNIFGNMIIKRRKIVRETEEKKKSLNQ